MTVILLCRASSVCVCAQMIRTPHAGVLVCAVLSLTWYHAPHAVWDSYRCSYAAVEVADRIILIQSSYAVWKHPMHRVQHLVIHFPCPLNVYATPFQLRLHFPRPRSPRRLQHQDVSQQIMPRVDVLLPERADLPRRPRGPEEHHRPPGKSSTSRRHCRR